MQCVALREKAEKFNMFIAGFMQVRINYGSDCVRVNIGKISKRGR